MSNEKDDAFLRNPINEEKQIIIAKARKLQQQVSEMAHACSAQREEALIHYCSRHAMNILGVGKVIARKLVNSSLVNSLSDLYRITQKDLTQIADLGAVTAKCLLINVEGTKQTTLYRFIFALGIPGVGKTTAKTLVNHFGSLEAISKASQEELQKVPDIGPIVSSGIVKFFSDKLNQKVISELINAGIRWNNIPVVKQDVVGKLSGKTFVITGTFQSMTRDEIISRIEANGGKVSSSVSKKTSCVLVGDDPGSKYLKAMSLGIQVILEDKLHQLF